MTAILGCLLAILALQVVAPYWWWIMIVPFVYGAAGARGGWRAARTGLLAAGLLWLGAGVYFLLTGSELIADRMARMFGLGRSWTMLVATALVAAAAGGLAGYAGHAVGGLVRKPARKEPS